VVYAGKVRDKVGAGPTALTADGQPDAVFKVTLSGGRPGNSYRG
jgi:hypothetical protein